MLTIDQLIKLTDDLVPSTGATEFCILYPPSFDPVAYLNDYANANGIRPFPDASPPEYPRLQNLTFLPREKFNARIEEPPVYSFQLPDEFWVFVCAGGPE